MQQSAKEALREQLQRLVVGVPVKQVRKGSRAVPSGDWKYHVRGVPVGVEVRY